MIKLKNSYKNFNGKSERTSPLSSPDLAPSDDFLFLVPKNHLHGTSFFSDIDVRLITGEWLKKLGHDFYHIRLNEFILSSDKSLKILVILRQSDR